MADRRRSQTGASAWPKIAAASWGRPTDPQIYGDLEVDAEPLLAFLEDVRAATGLHVSHPAVAEAAVIGIPDEAQGERVKALVVPHDLAGAGDALAEELIWYCRASLIKWACPREIEFRSELPTTRLGKVDYARLRSEQVPA